MAPRPLLQTPSPAENERPNLTGNSHSDGYSNAGTSVPMWGKTNGLSATLLWGPYPLRRAWTPVLHNESSEWSIRIGCRQQFVSGLEQDNSHADAHGHGFSAGGCS
jgi:hypothetical protein